jgi:F-type H+-transporting ATPase subunit b
MRRIAAAAVALLVLPAAAMAEGMPQLNFNNPLTTTQVEWGAAIFVVLYILLSRLGLPQVASVLEERGTRIAGDLETAHAAKARADGAVSEMTETTAKARAEAQAAINAALEQAKAAAAKQAAVLNEKLEAQLKEAETSIAAARNTAMAALREVATRQRHRHGNRRPTRRLNESPRHARGKLLRRAAQLGRNCLHRVLLAVRPQTLEGARRHA